jgi:hypothetical protein
MDVFVLKYDVNVLLAPLVLIIDELVDDVMHRSNFQGLTVCPQRKVVTIRIKAARPDRLRIGKLRYFPKVLRRKVEHDVGDAV